MKRLTRKFFNEESVEMYDIRDVMLELKKTYKLSQLEDDEERIGLDLHTLSRCKYIYIKTGKKIKKMPALINLRNECVLIQKFWIFVKPIPFSKFKIKWSLKKEDLENE